MNTGQSSDSKAIRFLTSEPVLAIYRTASVVALGVIGFFLMRMVSTNDDVARQMQDLRVAVASSIATNAATMQAIQDRVGAQSRRMDGFDIEIRDVRNKVYEGRK